MFTVIVQGLNFIDGAKNTKIKFMVCLKIKMFRHDDLNLKPQILNIELKDVKMLRLGFSYEHVAPPQHHFPLAFCFLCGDPLTLLFSLWLQEPQTSDPDTVLKCSFRYSKHLMTSYVTFEFRRKSSLRVNTGSVKNKVLFKSPWWTWNGWKNVLPATNNYKMVKRKRYRAPGTVGDVDSTCLASCTWNPFSANWSVQRAEFNDSGWNSAQHFQVWDLNMHKLRC